MRWFSDYGIGYRKKELGRENLARTSLNRDVARGVEREWSGHDCSSRHDSGCEQTWSRRLQGLAEAEGTQQRFADSGIQKLSWRRDVGAFLRRDQEPSLEGRPRNAFRVSNRRQEGGREERRDRERV